MSPDTHKYKSTDFKPQTLVDLLRWRAETRPNDRAFTFLIDGHKKEIQLTYSDLDKKVRAFAAVLQKKGLTGERALLLYPPGIDYIIAFFACLYAGVIAVPAYPPDPNRLNRTLPRLQAIVRDAQATLALTNDSILYMIKILKLGSKFTDTLERMPVLRKFKTTMNYFTTQSTGLASTKDLGDLQWISSNDILDNQADSWHENKKTDANSIAFLQYTSGSTGVPKGVILTHDNLLANSADIYTAFGYSDNTEGVIWLPIYHDMGLIGGILQPIYGGMATTLLSPIHFLQRPLSWLDTISKIKSKDVVSGGPNFAYDLCVKKVTPDHLENLDLSNWSVAFSGAEPVRTETIERFYETFKGSGFRKEAFLSCYGLAEATLYVSGVDFREIPLVSHLDKTELRNSIIKEVDAQHPEAQAMVSCGKTPPAQNLEIVNPQTFEKVAAGEIGEIWLQGPNIAQGYWNRPDATEETFKAFIKHSDKGHFLRTGDLGYLKNDELFITGRNKDLIIIRGRNYYPQDIEFLVENAHEDIRPGCSAAFSIEENQEENLVVVAELRQKKNVNFDDIISAIRLIITETNDIRVHKIVLIKARSIAKTSSGKIQRHAIKNEFLDNKLKAIFNWDGTGSISEDAVVDEFQIPEPSINTDTLIQKETRPIDKPKESSMEIESWLVSEMAKALGINKIEIDTKKPFVSYGLDSAQAIGLVGDLEEYLDRELSPTIIWDYPNVEALVKYLQGDEEKSPIRISRQKETGANEPIAIIGYSLRMPGAKNATQFWENLKNGVDSISEVPASRWNVDDFYDATPGKPGKMITRWGGFIDDVDQFDPLFFGISPREAPHMDPQQRLLLEVSFEAIEHAGYNMQTISGTNTGVYIAISSADYVRLQVGDFKHLDAYTGIGNAYSIAANRLSFIYDLKGPSFIVDTACSSSLVAIHNAINNLRHGECEMAIVGGVNLVLAPDVTITFSQAQMMSPNGRCKTFDASADGYVRGDGIGVVMLKSLSSALKDGDKIRAIIRGSAINQDGKSNGITAPNGLAQQSCIRLALNDAGIKPEDIQYFETHGTGTPLGDPIETEAIKAVMLEGRNFDNKLIIGSVKTNIGHLESAAGISGLLKTVLALEHEMIPKHVHFKQLNPHINFDNTPISIATETQNWTRNEKTRFAGVSAFGFGGTNAHIVLQEAPETLYNKIERDFENVSGPFLLPISAHSESAVSAMAKSYHLRLKDDEFQHIETFVDFLFTAATHRGKFDYNAVIIAKDISDIRNKLAQFDEEKTPGIIKDSAEANIKAKTVFVYSGQGQQWFAMGRQLYDHEPVFRKTINDIDKLLSKISQWSLIEELQHDEQKSKLSETEIAQPAIFAIQVALTNLWESWDVKPAAIVGHSVGEVTAAYISGTLSLEDAVKVIFHRGRLMQRATGFGKMVSVDLAIDNAKNAIKGYEDKIGIGAHNSPENTVLSGEENALKEVISKLDADGVYTKMLRVNYAFHSPHMDAFKQELIDSLKDITVKKPSVPVYSTLSGVKSMENDYNAEYWSNNIREKVSFADAITNMITDGYSVFVEISAHPVLSGSISQCLRHAKKHGTIVSSLKRKEDEKETLFTALGTLFCKGYPILWEKVQPQNGRFKELPAYPWQHDRYWFDIKGNDPNNAPIFKKSLNSFTGGHPLLGKAQDAPLSPGKKIYNTFIELDRIAYLKDHKVQDSIVFPAAGYLEMGLATITDNENQFITLENVNFFRALSLKEDIDQQVQLVYTPYTNQSAGFQIFTMDGQSEHSDGWLMNAMGSVRISNPDQQKPADKSVIELRERITDTLSTAEFYELLTEKGLQYGPNFQSVKEIFTGTNEALAKIEIENDSDDLNDYKIHPRILDACFQVLSAAIDQKQIQDDQSTFIPVHIDRLSLYERPNAALWCYAQLKTEITSEADQINGDLFIFNEEDQIIADVLGLKLQRLGHKKDVDLSDWFYKISWHDAALAKTELSDLSDDCWVIFTEQNKPGIDLANQIKTLNGQVIIVQQGEKFSKTDDFFYAINPRNKADFTELFAEIKNITHGNIKGIVNFWPLDIKLSADCPAEVLYKTQEDLLLCNLYLVQAFKESGFGSTPRMALVTENAQKIDNDKSGINFIQSSVWGLGRVITSENPQMQFMKIDVDKTDTEAISFILQDLLAKHKDDQIAYRKNIRKVARLVRSRNDYENSDLSASGSEKKLFIPEGPFELKTINPGVLSGLHYQKNTRKKPAAGQVEIEVRAAGLNFRDVLMALGLYPGDPIPFGSECSGTISAIGPNETEFKIGDEVIAIAPSTFSKYCMTYSDLVVKKPDNINFEEAATIPVTYLTAYYAMVYLGRLAKGERILIHAGAGGVGQAAIQIAQMIGAEVYTTAGSVEKRQYLQAMKIDNVFNSRTLDFADEILEITANQGVDMVLNSLAGEFIPRSIHLLKPYGRFLEIGKTDLFQNSQIDMYPFRNNLSFSAVDLDMLSRDKPALIKQLFNELMLHFADGKLKPLNLKCFEATEVGDAFRYMAQRKNIGKIVISMHQNKPEIPDTNTDSFIKANASYLITGGTGNLGLLISEWLINRGAKNLILVARNTPNEKTIQHIEALKVQGAKIEIKKADVSDFEQIQSAFNEIQTDCPDLKGIIHAAGVLSDSALDSFESEKFKIPLKPKIAGTYNLHLLSKGLNLDFFVCFSSVAATIGNPGQGNYAAANLFMDSLMHWRKEKGLPGLSINWGFWDTIGMGADQKLSLPGVSKIDPEKGIRIFNQLIKSDLSQTVVIPVNLSQFLAPYPDEYIPQLYLEFKDLKKKKERTDSREGLKRDDLIKLSAEERHLLMTSYLLKKISQVLGVPESKLETDKPLNSIGLDSLMAIEIKNSIESSLNTNLAIATLLKGPSINDLTKDMLTQILEEVEGVSKEITKKDDFPLSHGQQAMWFQHQLNPASIFNMVYAVRIPEKINIETLKKSLKEMSMRHESLRTNFITENGTPKQIINTETYDILEEVDVTNLSEEDFKKALDEKINKPFDLQNDSLTRIILFNKADGSQVFLYLAHHIVSDMWSLAIFMYELNKIYSNNGVNNLTKIDFSYLDYVRQTNEQLAGTLGQKHYDYWKKQLQGELPVINIQSSKSRPPIQTYAGLTETINIDSKTTTKLTQIAKENNTTLYAFLLAIFKVLIHHYSGQEDLIIGTPTSGRTSPEVAPVLGYFVNPVAIRSTISGNDSFQDYLAQIKEHVLNALEHQDYPFNLLVEKLKPRRDPSRTPIFQIMFVYQKAYLLHDSGMSGFTVAEEGTTMKFGDLTLESVAVDERVVPFDMTMLMAEIDDGLGASLQYNTDLFTRDFVLKFLDHFKNLIHLIVDNPAVRISNINLLNINEKQIIIENWNNSDQLVSAEMPVQKIFESIVNENKDKTAVVFKDSRLSYDDLNKKANIVAHHLITKGVNPDSVVGLCFERSFEMIIGILGILKAGAAYLPLDSNYPVDRLKYMLHDSECRFLLTQKELIGRLPQNSAEKILIEELTEKRDNNLENPRINQNMSNLAYLIYTSGSTGRPKGVMLTQAGLCNLALAQINEFRINRDTHLLQFASVSFDAAASEIFTTLLSGATLFLIEQEKLLSGPDLIRFFTENKITTATIPPSVLRVLQPQNLNLLQTVISAGESLTPEIAARWSENRHMINAYGPTEGTICASCYHFENWKDKESIPIGQPISNVKLYVLNKYLNPVPVGVPGELYIGGHGVARGYYNKPALTAAVFIPDPFSGINGARLYKTGDLVRFSPDGNIEFLDRIDYQVKIRGFRIELGEIETLLKAQSTIKDCLVLARGTTDKKLTAYVIPVNGSKEIELDELKYALRQNLPDYMVPTFIIPISTFPLTVNGKIDLKALPDPEVSKTEFVKASNEVEKKLTDIWQQVLNIEQIGIYDNFFELGGHSLNIVQTQNKIREVFDKEINVVDMFRYPTISAFAKYMSNGQKEAKEAVQKSQDRGSRQREATRLAQQRLKKRKR